MSPHKDRPLARARLRVWDACSLGPRHDIPDECAGGLGFARAWRPFRFPAETAFVAHLGQERPPARLEVAQCPLERPGLACNLGGLERVEDAAGSHDGVSLPPRNRVDVDPGGKVA